MDAATLRGYTVHLPIIKALLQGEGAIDLDAPDDKKVAHVGWVRVTGGGTVDLRDYDDAEPGSMLIVANLDDADAVTVRTNGNVTQVVAAGRYKTFTKMYGAGWAALT